MFALQNWQAFISANPKIASALRDELFSAETFLFFAEFAPPSILVFWLCVFLVRKLLFQTEELSSQQPVVLLNWCRQQYHNISAALGGRSGVFCIDCIGNLCIYMGVDGSQSSFLWEGRAAALRPRPPP